VVKVRISESVVQFSTARQYIAQESSRETLRAWVGTQRPAGDAPADSGAPAATDDRPAAWRFGSRDRLDLGAADTQRSDVHEAMRRLARAHHGRGIGPGRSSASPRGLERGHAHAPAAAAGAPQTSGSAEIEEDNDLEPKLGFLKLLLERIYGIRVKTGSKADGLDCQPCDRTDAQSVDRSPGQGRRGWGIEITTDERRFESETTTFTASGVVKTADGKTISFTLGLSMHREYLEETHSVLRAGDAAVDPLVVNFNGTAAQLSDTAFRFDLQGDGEEETIPTLEQGSGFLALDKNGDGRITDGTELFGPSSGDGFAELAAYDADGNQWIDESDPIYAQLRLWQPDAEGKGALPTLSEGRVGAIYLGRAETPFSLTTSQNALRGQITASGIYLSETGGVGSVQQVDLAV
jgi:hypothetical protein